MAVEERAMRVTQRLVRERVRYGTELLDLHYPGWYVIADHYVRWLYAPPVYPDLIRVLPKWQRSYFLRDAFGEQLSVAELQSYGYLAKGSYKIGIAAENALLRNYWLSVIQERMAYEARLQQEASKRERAVRRRQAEEEARILRDLLKGLHDDAPTGKKRP